MLALLVLSSIAAALIPVDRDRLSPREESSTEASEPRIPAGTFVHRRISVQASKPAKVSLEVGDQLDLVVTSKRPGQIEIPAFGELDNVEAAFPAHFDLLALEAGSFAVRLVGQRTIARIEVSEADQGKGEGESSSDEPGSSTAASTSGASSAS